MPYPPSAHWCRGGENLKTSFLVQKIKKLALLYLPVPKVPHTTLGKQPTLPRINMEPQNWLWLGGRFTGTDLLPWDVCAVLREVFRFNAFVQHLKDRENRCRVRRKESR